MPREIMLGKERFLPEPRNTRGWPKNRRQLDWALLVVRDDMPRGAAARRVYGEHVSDKHIFTLGRQLLPFMAHLQEVKNAIAERAFEVSTERILRESAAIALADRVTFSRAVTIKGRKRFIGKPPDELTQVQRISIREWSEHEVETDDGTEIDFRYQLHGKQAAIEFIGKHLGMLSEKLLVEMVARRAAQNTTDYSNVPTPTIEDAIRQLTELKERLKDDHAIVGESMPVASAE